MTDRAAPRLPPWLVFDSAAARSVNAFRGLWWNLPKLIENCRCGLCEIGEELLSLFFLEKRKLFSYFTTSEVKNGKQIRKLYFSDTKKIIR